MRSFARPRAERRSGGSGLLDGRLERPDHALPHLGQGRLDQHTGGLLVTTAAGVQRPRDLGDVHEASAAQTELDLGGAALDQQDRDLAPLHVDHGVDDALDVQARGAELAGDPLCHAAEHDRAVGVEGGRVEHTRSQQHARAALLHEDPDGDGRVIDALVEQASRHPVGGRRGVAVAEAAGVEDHPHVELLGEGVVQRQAPGVHQAQHHAAGALRLTVDQRQRVALGRGGVVVVDDGGGGRAVEGPRDRRRQAVAVAVQHDGQVVGARDGLVRHHLGRTGEPGVAESSHPRDVYARVRQGPDSALQRQTRAEAVAVRVLRTSEQDSGRGLDQAA